jgi:6-phosphogluconolactonase
MLYALLASSPWRNRIDWGRIEWFFGDERTVPPDHPDNNYRMARETLLDPLSIASDCIHRMMTDVADLDRAARDYEHVLRSHVSQRSGEDIPVLDLVLLGIGNDGHTASLFPDSIALAERLRLVVPNYVSSQKTWRMTLTYPVLWAAGEVLFFVTGASKAEAVARIYDPNADMVRLPSVGLRKATGRVIWILDSDAARLVRPSLRL